MTMTPSLRKLALTIHITFSVGWLGAVAAFLALAVAGLTSRDAQLVRAAYLATELTTWSVIVPLAFAALITGAVQSLGTTCGLFRHYWVVAKFLLTVLATTLLLLHTQPISFLARIAAERALSTAERQLQIQIVADAALALLVLLLNTALGVYQPRGMTQYGRRKQQEQHKVSPPIPPQSLTRTVTTGDAHATDLAVHLGSNDDSARPERGSNASTPHWVYVSGITMMILVLLFAVLHLTGGGLGGH
jgi:hypothetical protein